MIYLLKKYVLLKRVLPESIEGKYFSVHIHLLFSINLRFIPVCKLRKGVFYLFFFFFFFFFLQNALF